jgi:hypothetical protein
VARLARPRRSRPTRIHAARIAGSVVANEYDPATGALVLTTHGGSVPHAIYIPERSAATFAITCNGMPREASRDPATGLVAVVCDGELDVTP